MPDLLIELFSEEIPARMQKRAAEDLKRLVTDGLVEAGLTYGGAAGFSTPRRLTLAIEGLLAESPATREERKGPRTDAPEKALEGFLRSTGLSKDQLEARDDKKGQVWFAVIAREGRPASEIIAEVLEAAIRNFPWPKSMRWGAGTLKWVRPLHSVLCILSDEAGASIVDFEIEGIRAGDTTHGHRFMAPDPIRVTGFDDYDAKLKSAFVVLSAEDRAETIWHDATQMAFAQGLDVVEDKGLLAEVAGLVEWPVALMGAIGADFLELPAEVLQTSMKEHQKFFSVKDKQGRITHFVTVANRETADSGATILAGNQKVLSARLADAKFFWENDLRVASVDITSWTDQLANVTFHNKLGSVQERIKRISKLAREIAPLVGADADEAQTAALIAKADLSSEMVYEFPELQGIMGEYYAQKAELSDEIAAVAREHYQPLGPSDDVPSAPLSVAVALADKIDTLTGFWAIDEKPTGSKDPFALRRAALGVIRLVLDGKHRLGLAKLIEAANEIAGPRDGRLADVSDLNGFINDRLKVYLRDKGIRFDVIDAALAMPNADDLTLLVKRAEALQTFLGTEDGENLTQGFKRAHNILKQAEEKDGVEYSYGPDPKLAEGPVEVALFKALDAVEALIARAMKGDDFGAAMAAMATLRGPVDAFFEDVQVNAENAILRRNRLNLLHRISATCLGVADLTRIDG
ncbi:glycine--tRNA ligase subunit beta [Rhodobacteraceae bacterium]|nr:glycine--tRNA ligase subunit beta [Paracoccaceae bacterium]